MGPIYTGDFPARYLVEVVIFNKWIHLLTQPLLKNESIFFMDISFIGFLWAQNIYIYIIIFPKIQTPPEKVVNPQNHTPSTS